MNSKQRRTLEQLFEQPTSASVAWEDVERLLRAIGCEVRHGAGSRVKFVKDGKIASFHRPHPDKEAKRYQVEDARAFLTRLGVTP